MTPDSGILLFPFVLSTSRVPKVTFYFGMCAFQPVQYSAVQYSTVQSRITCCVTHHACHLLTPTLFVLTLALLCSALLCLSFLSFFLSFFLPSFLSFFLPSFLSFVFSLSGRVGLPQERKMARSTCGRELSAQLLGRCPGQEA